MNKTSEMKVDHFEWNLDEKSRIYIYIYIKKRWEAIQGITEEDRHR
jgi:hypothetical protein